MRRLVANLDAELAWRGDARTLPAAARAVIAGWGSLLRVFAAEGDRLWLPASLDPRRLAADGAGAASSLPRPALDHGRLDDPPGTPTLRWAQALRRGGFEDVDRQGVDLDDIEPEVTGPDPVDDLPLLDDPIDTVRDVERLGARLWSLPPTTPTDGVRAARVNHRGFGLELARRLGVAAPGAGMVSTLEDAGRRLAEASSDRWVAKAPLTSSGRDRVWLDAASSHDRLEAVLGPLLRRHGALALEPWDERVDDIGQLLWVGERAVRRLGVHRLRVDPHGRFLGIEVPAAGDALGLGTAEQQALRGVARDVGRALHDAGYRGPVGIDARRVARAEGETVLRPLGEINARLTIGHLAHALVARLGMRRPALLAASSSATSSPVDAARGADADGAVSARVLAPDADGRGGLSLVSL